MTLGLATPQRSLREVMTFRKGWRIYQSRLLDQLDRYLENKRLHLVAAPGSGKTVLGLEVIRRVSQATLILAPTITIRDQWVDRLIELFLPPDQTRPAWISTNLKTPAFLTVATYQALHAVCSGEAEEQTSVESDASAADKNHVETSPNGEEADHVSRALISIPPFLTEAKFKTLVLDEAHHLRAEWWRVLTSFAEQLEKPTIVALTATPPYDVSPFEWQRYEELCGPVDAEVSVPELVQEGDLLVWSVNPGSSQYRNTSNARAALRAIEVPAREFACVICPAYSERHGVSPVPRRSDKSPCWRDIQGLREFLPWRNRTSSQKNSPRVAWNGSHRAAQSEASRSI